MMRGMKMKSGFKRPGLKFTSSSYFSLHQIHGFDFQLTVQYLTCFWIPNIILKRSLIDSVG